MLIRTLMLTLLISVMAPAAAVSAQNNAPQNANAQSDAKKAFAKLKTLSGSWQGTVMGKSINMTIRLASSGSAILHEATADGGGVPDQEITMFYVEGDRLLAIHYCDAANRSRMEGKLSSDGNSVEFDLLEVTGGTQRGFLKRIAFTIVDASHHGIAGIFIMPDGKPIQLSGNFQRTK